MARHIKRLGTLACALVFIAHCSAEAGVRRHDVPDSQYIALANSEPEFQATGAVQWNESGSSFLGSGTLITDQWVLTAAHNIDGSGLSNLRFTVGSNLYTADDWFPHPNWLASGGESNLFSGWDIGLIRLGTSVDNITPAQLYNGNSELGQIGTAVGFGATGVGQALPDGTPAGFQPATAGTFRAGQNVVDVVGGTQTPGSNPNFRFGHDRILAVDFDNPTNFFDSTLGSSSPLALEYLTAPGDSGGGLFLDIGGVQMLAGVTSFGSTSDGLIDDDYGDRGSFTRVSSFLDWIDETIELNTPSLPGDFNNDGLVDGLDFLVWQRGESPNPLSATDLAEFEINYGAPANSFAAIGVPEPGTASILLAALTWFTGPWARAPRTLRNAPLVGPQLPPLS